MKNMFKDKKILIIGGTGTIGRRIFEMLIQCEPEVIRIFSRDEFKQFEMQNEIGEDDRVRYLIGDVRDYVRVVRATKGCDFVIHTAAMKHVPACEYNPFEAVHTNVIGTQNVIRASIENGVKRVVLTSSDKAISPTNAMGATKLLAEKLISTANFSYGTKVPMFSAVRFGNVMGSRGSVIPLFVKQILEQQHVMVTKMEMTRFMMSITQAAKLTLKALNKSKGGEIFVLKMPVMRIGDLAEVVIEETCKKHDMDVSNIIIEEIGMRPGEKMYEELMTEDESHSAYNLKDMYAILPPLNELHYKNKYVENEKAEIKSYGSRNERTIGKEEIRKIIIAEGLV